MKQKMTRREILKLFGASSLALPFLPGCGGFEPLTSGSLEDPSSAFSAIETKGKNVLFIAVDDLNDWISVLGGYEGAVQTPNLERLAKMGITFRKAYCAVPWCAPSRAATMTGVSPATSKYYGAGSNDVALVPSLANVETLPAYFRRRGYRTVGSGKIFHGRYPYGAATPGDWISDGQERLGWDTYQQMAAEPHPPSGPNNGLSIPWDNFDWSETYDPPLESMPDWQLAQWAAQQLAQPADKPFFLGVGFYRPHLPWYAPKKFMDLYPLSSIQIPAHLRDGNDLDDVPSMGVEIAKFPGDHERILAADPTGLSVWKKGVRCYLASVSFADACLGVVLDALEKSEHAKNTIIVLWSDNGFQLGEKRSWRKFKLWEKSARVPVIVAVPGSPNAGRFCDKPISLLDLYPTLAKLCTDAQPSHLEGNDITPLLANPLADWRYAALTSYPQTNDGAQLHRSVRTENFRYILYADGADELYDHRVDPREKQNLLYPAYGRAAEARQIANVLKALLPPAS